MGKEVVSGLNDLSNRRIAWSKLFSKSRAIPKDYWASSGYQSLRVPLHLFLWASMHLLLTGYAWEKRRTRNRKAYRLDYIDCHWSTLNSLKRLHACNLPGSVAVNCGGLPLWCTSHSFNLFHSRPEELPTYPRFDVATVILLEPKISVAKFLPMLAL